MDATFDECVQVCNRKLNDVRHAAQMGVEADYSSDREFGMFWVGYALSTLKEATADFGMGCLKDRWLRQYSVALFVIIQNMNGAKAGGAAGVQTISLCQEALKHLGKRQITKRCL